MISKIQLPRGLYGTHVGNVGSVCAGALAQVAAPARRVAIDTDDIDVSSSIGKVFGPGKAPLDDVRKRKT